MTGQAYCVLKANMQTMSSRYTWHNYKVLKQEDWEAWHQDLRLHEAYFKYTNTQAVHIFHAEKFLVKNQPFLNPPCLHTPSLSRPLLLPIFHEFFCHILLTCVSIWNTQYSAGIWVTHTEKGNPIIVSPCTWNEWICTVSSGLDSNADITMISHCHLHAKALQAFHPSQRRGTAMTSPRIFGSSGHCLFVIAAAAFEYRWSSENIYHLLVLPKGIHCVPSDPICSANWETSKQHEPGKLQNLQKSRNIFPFLCFIFGWSPKQANTGSVTKKLYSQSLPLMICVTLQSRRSAY